MARSFRQWDHALWMLVVASIVCVGCRKGADLTPGTTAAPGTTVPPGTTAAPGTTVPPGTTAAEAFGGIDVDLPGDDEMVAPEATEAAPEESAVDDEMVDVEMVAINIELPAPAFRGTPVPLKEPNIEKPLGKPRPPFLAPEGTVNVSRGKAVSSSDPRPVAGELDFVTDGDKEASDFGFLELHPGTQWVQIDLGQETAIYAVVVWHQHAEARVYRDVIVQVSDDPDFVTATMVYNNDDNNSSGKGIGEDLGYVETAEGRLIDCQGVEGRYIRLYSRGNHVDDKNHYTEVEVFGRPTG